MGFSVLTNAEQQSSRVKYQKAGLRGLQYTNEHKSGVWTKYVKAGFRAAKYIKAGLWSVTGRRRRVPAGQSMSSQGCRDAETTEEGDQCVKVW